MMIALLECHRKNNVFCRKCLELPSEMLGETWKKEWLLQVGKLIIISPNLLNSLKTQLLKHSHFPSQLLTLFSKSEANQILSKAFIDSVAALHHCMKGRCSFAAVHRFMSPVSIFMKKIKNKSIFIQQKTLLRETAVQGYV